MDVDRSRRLPRLMPLGNDGRALCYADFDVRLPVLATENMSLLHEHHAVRNASIEKRLGYSLIPEGHCHIVGAIRGTSFTDPIPVASAAGIAGGIGIGARVRYRRDRRRAIPVDVDVG